MNVAWADQHNLALMYQYFIVSIELYISIQHMLLWMCFFYFTQVPQTSKSKAQPPFLTTYGSFFRMGGSSIFVKKR